MSEGWKVKKLGKVLDVQNGYAFNSKMFNPSIGLPLVRIRSLKAGTENKTRFSGEYDKKYIVNSGDLLVGMDGEFGCYEWKGEPALLNQRVCRLQGFDSQLLPRFLYYGVNSFLKAIEDVTGFTTVKHLSSKKILDIDFPLPPLPEQKRIVDILDEAFEGIDAAIANTQKNLSNARELFDSYLNDVFTKKGEGWEETTLGDICDFQNGFAFKSSDTVDQSNVQLIRMGNLYQNVLDLDRKPSFYPDSFSSGYERYELREGDLIMSLTGTVDKEDYGYTVVIPKSEKTLLLNQRIAKFINLSIVIHKDYLLYLLRSRVFLDQLYAGASGTRQANLSTNKMKSISFSLPSMEQQSKIIEKIQTLDCEAKSLEAIYQQKLDALNELKQSLLAKAFSGELTAQSEQVLKEAVG